MSLNKAVLRPLVFRLQFHAVPTKGDLRDVLSERVRREDPKPPKTVGTHKEPKNDSLRLETEQKCTDGRDAQKHSLEGEEGTFLFGWDLGPPEVDL